MFHTVTIFVIINMFYKEFAVMFIIYFYAEFHMYSSKSSLVTDYYKFRAAVMMFYLHIL
jgi:hypothetical protein